MNCGRLAGALLLVLFSGAVSALTSQHDLLLDLDGRSGTGCSVATSDGSFDGVELMVSATVETDGSDAAEVTEVVWRECTDASSDTFSAPAAEGGGWPVGVDAGIDGFHVIETRVSLPASQRFEDTRIGVVAVNELGDSATFLQVEGNAIILRGLPPLPVPVAAGAALLLLALVLLLLGLWSLGHRGRLTLTTVVLITGGGIAVAGAVYSGALADWSAEDLLAENSIDDPGDGVGIRALFGQRGGSGTNTVYFRIDSALMFTAVPVPRSDRYTTGLTSPINETADSGLLANDDRGLPIADLVSFGGGDLSASVGDHAAGDTVTIGADGNLTVNADGSFDFQAESGFDGPFVFHYRIENDVGSGTAEVTVDVNSPPVAQDDVFDVQSTESLDSGAGALLSNDSGWPEPTVSNFGGGDLGGSVDDNAAGDSVVVGSDGSLSISADGRVLFTPPDGITGEFSFDYRIANPEGTDAATVVIVIEQAPAITSAAEVTCSVGSACDFAFTAEGFPEPTITLDGGLPGGVTFNAATESLEGTPDAGTGAEYSLTLTADNGITPEATQSFTLTVNEGPAITSADNLTCQVDQPCDFSFAADGHPDPDFAITAGALPSSLTLAADGTLSGTPAAGDGADYALTIEASNSTGSDTQSFALTINEAPTITSGDGLTCEVGASCDFTFTADGFPDPSFNLAGLPSGLSLDTSTGVLSGTPDAGTGAEYSLTLTADNGVTPEATQSFTLTVNEAPVANNDPEGGIPGGSSPGSVSHHGAFDTTLNVSSADGVLGNDTRGFPQADIVSSDTTSTGGGSVSVNADGSFGYTPAAGFTGIDSFGYCIENAGGNDCATVEVAVGERPSATNATYPQTLVGNVGIDTALDSGFGVAAGGDAITLDVAGTTNGDAGIGPGGTFTFNPAAGVTGANGLLEYSVANGFGTVTATVTIPIGTVRIWFVDIDAAGSGDGRLGTPFNTLGAAEAAADAGGDRIFLYTGGGDYAAGIVLLDDQRLLGQGAGEALATIAGVTPPGDSVLPATGGSAPTIVNSGGNGIALAQNNRLQGFAVGNTSGSGIAGNGFGTLTVADVAIFGSGQALDLTNGSVAGAGFASVSSGSGTRNVSLVNVGGGLDLGGGTLSGASGQAFYIDGGSGTTSYAGTISNTANRVAEIENKTGGAVTLSGELTSNSGGTGIRVANNSGGSAITFSGASKVLNSGTNEAVTLAGNTGATVSFTNGGLDIDTTSGAGFSATGGGTVVVSGAANTVDSTTGTGVNIANTTIGAAGVTLRSVSVNGAGAGIVLDTTGSAGHFEVTGDGASSTADTTAGRTTSAAGGGTLGLGSGGTIINTTDGVRLTNASNVTLRNMVIGNGAVTQNDAVSTATSITDNGIEMAGVAGLTLDNVIISETGDHGILGTGSNAGLAMIHTEIFNAGDEGSDADGGDDAMQFGFASGSDTLTGSVTFTSVAIAGMSDTGMEVENTSGNLDLTVTDSFIGNNDHSDASCNPCEGDGFLLRADGGSATIDMVVQDTTFNDIANDGIDLGNDQASNMTTLIAENVSGTNNDGADNLIDTANTNGTLRARVSNLSSDSAHRGTVLFFKADGAATTDVTIDNSTIQGSDIGNGIEVFIDGDPGTGSLSDGNARVLVRNTQLSNIYSSGVTLNVQDMPTGSSTAGFLDATLDNVTTSQPLRTDTIVGSVRGVADSGAGNGATLQLQIIDSVIGLGSFDSGFGFQSESLDFTGDSNVDIACVDDGNGGNGTPCTNIGSTTSDDGVVAGVMNESGNQVNDGGPRAFVGGDVFTSSALRGGSGEVQIISPTAVTDPVLP